MKQAAVFFADYGQPTPLEYSLIPGFWKPAYAYELPQWVAYLRDVEFVVLSPQDELKRLWLYETFDRIFVSVMDANKAEVRRLISPPRIFYNKKFYEDKIDKIEFVLGGYVDPKEFVAYPNVRWLDKPPFKTPDYTPFRGTRCIPRLELSYGCRYNCAFCSVARGVYERPEEEILAEAFSIAENLEFQYVYIGDKTFGQASNYKLLLDLRKLFERHKKGFKGFIIQTTSADLSKLHKYFIEDAAIKFVEIGLETYNDPILKHYKKPSTEALIDEAFEKASSCSFNAGFLLIPNVVVGFPQENEQTYKRTLDVLDYNRSVISHLNIYNMAVYENARDLSKLPVVGSDMDRQENETDKSWGNFASVFEKFKAFNEQTIKIRYS